MTFREAVIDATVNAATSWMAISLVLIAAAWSFLTNAVLWGGFALVIVFVAVLPALLTHDATALVHWPLLAVVAFAILARTAGVYPKPAGYLVLATFAIMVVVELVDFTSVELGRWFAVGFGVMMAMALEAIWIIAQFYSDVWLGTKFLTTQTALQKDIVIVTIVGFVVGGFFLWFFEIVEPMETTSRSADDAQSR